MPVRTAVAASASGRRGGAVGDFARRGVLVARTCAMKNALASADLLACDRTSTLTTGGPRLLRQLLLLRTADPEYTLAIAAAMGTLSTHPYARALMGAVQSLGRITHCRR